MLVLVVPHAFIGIEPLSASLRIRDDLRPPQKDHFGGVKTSLTTDVNNLHGFRDTSRQELVGFYLRR